jgi:hypothetical protein
VSDEDLVPISVRLGNVVPPEDPEDWTRPLTWVAALGILAGPIATFAWFTVAPPRDGSAALPLTYLVAALLAGGSAATGATQLGRARAWTATLAAGLFAALAIVVLGVVTAGERQVGVASPTLAHGFAAALGGLGGAAAAALVAGIAAALGSRLLRFLPALGVGAMVAIGSVAALMP